MVAALNPGTIQSKSLTFSPTAATPAQYVGQEYWVELNQTYWKNVGYSVAIGYLWVQLYPSTTALTIPDGALYGVSNALTGIPLTADLTFLGSSGGTGAAITFVAGSGISLTQAAGTLTIASTSTPVTLPTGVQYYNGSTLSGINTVTDLTLIGAVSGAPGIVSLVAGTNMSIAQVGGNITFNSTYTYTPPTLPTGVQVYTGTALEGLEPIATLQVIGNDGAGNVAVTTLVAGTNMSISQAGPYITFDSTYTPTLPTGVQVYTGTVLEGLEPTATLEVIGNDGAGNVAVATLVAGTNMSISQVGSNITFNSTYTPTLPTGVQVYTGTTLEGLDPTAALEVIGNDGAGNVAVSTLVAGTNVTITQTGSDYTIASTNTGSTSGIVGVYSPVQSSITGITSNIFIFA
jgi:ribosomal protein L14